MDLIDVIRRRPGMYVGGCDDQALVHLAMEVLGNAFDQHLLGRCDRIEVAIEPDGTLVVSDDGDGISIDGDERRPPLASLVTVGHHTPTADGHRPHVHLAHAGVGLAVVNALSAAFEVETVHAGVRARGRWRHGRPDGAIAATPTTAPSGTRLRCTPDPEIFGDHRIDVVAVLDRIDTLVALRPGLVIDVQLAGRQHEPDGLTAQVRRLLRPWTATVAAARRDVVTADGPLTVDVAVAWKHVPDDPAISSFVNYQRNRDHGTHVDGLFDGILRVFGGTRVANGAGLVAAVAVVLADVHWGNPTKDRLATPAVRKPVADVTEAALHAWSAAHPDDAAARRARLSGR
ncbi:MAG: ATP-binding protein [Kofleriaceae bacterium]